MKFIIVLFMLTSLHFYGQQNSATYQFQVYHNGVFENKKSVTISVIIEKDTITCPIANEQIKLPTTNLKGTFLINYKKKSYRIEDVDFSRVEDKSLVIFGLEKHLGNFIRISEDQPDLYSIKDTVNSLRIENLEQAKEICFISFSSSTYTNKRLAVKTYNKTIITQNKNGT